MITSPDSVKTAPGNLLPSMEVNILDSRPGLVLVRRLGHAEPVGWIPRDAIVWPNELKRLHTWPGPGTFQVDTNEGCKSHRSYHFQSDGTCTVEVRLEKNAPVQHKGHLYAYGPVILASGTEDSFFFWRQGSGDLCAPSQPGTCTKP